MPITIPETYKQYGQVPFFYMNGFGISNDATTPNTLLDVDVGTCIDSTETFQIEMLSPAVINIANNGLNGLDSGTIAANKVYAVYAVADPVTQSPTGCMLSLNYASGNGLAPLLPFGYSAYALLGFVAIDASSHILKGYWTNSNTNNRLFMFDAPQATAVTAGSSTTYANVDLTKFVPLFNNLPVWIASSYTPSAASQVLDLQPGNATGNAIAITGQVTSVVVTSNSLLLAQNVVISSVNSPTINYKLTSGGAVAINVAGYFFYV